MQYTPQFINYVHLRAQEAKKENEFYSKMIVKHLSTKDLKAVEMYKEMIELNNEEIKQWEKTRNGNRPKEDSKPTQRSANSIRFGEVIIDKG